MRERRLQSGRRRVGGVVLASLVVAQTLGFETATWARQASVRLEWLVSLGSVDDPACKPVFDAMDRVLDVPSHEFMIKAGGKGEGGKTTQSELITVNGSRYVMVSGRWAKSPATTTQLREQEAENKKNAKVFSCKKAGGEMVNGEPTTIYTIHSETEDAKSDGKLWISNLRGLPLKEEASIDMGDGDVWHSSVRFEYSNVHAPQL
jgi:hypothetical protein